MLSTSSRARLACFVVSYSRALESAVAALAAYFSAVARASASKRASPVRTRASAQHAPRLYDTEIAIGLEPILVHDLDELRAISPKDIDYRRGRIRRERVCRQSFERRGQIRPLPRARQATK